MIELLNKLKKSELSDNEYKELLEDTYNLLSENNLSDDSYSMCLDVVCHVADKGSLNLLNKELLKECIYKSRVFLYEDTLYKKYSVDYFNNTSNSILFDISKSFYTLSTNTILTRDQKDLFDNFKKYKRVVISAPTSFGKSRIIQEIIISEGFNNILIVVPTLALSNELYLKLKNLEKLQSYNIVKTTKNYKDSEKNILLFTPEKALMLLDEHPDLEVDFFVMDEIYKIAHEDSRKEVFCNCLYEFVVNRSTRNFYLIGPYFKKFSKIFLDKTNSKFFKYNCEVVKKNNHNITLKKTGAANLNKAIAILQADEEQSLIYCARKHGINSKVKKIIAKEITKESSYFDRDFVEYLKQEIDENWILVKALEKGVAFHHASMPSYVKNEIISAYNEQKIKVILCTTTIIEGVNTSAKKVIILDSNKGNGSSLLTPFEIKNIKGRAGRFMEHFIGDIYVLTADLKEEQELEDIEFSYFDKDLLEDSELMQVHDEHIKNKNRDRKKKIRQEISDAGVEFKFIKQNRYISHTNQLELIKELRKSSDCVKSISFKKQFPSNEVFGLIFQLCENYLFSDNDKNRPQPFRGGQLIALMNFYVSDNYQSPRDLIKHNFIVESSQNINTRINTVFKFITTYCEFTMPKYLRAFQNIYNYVKLEKNETKNCNFNLDLYLLKLEFGTINPVEIELKELGLPKSITKKLSSNSVDELKTKTNDAAFIKKNFSNFERRLLNRYL